MTENVLQDILPPESSKQLFLHPLPKISIEILTAMCRSYFNEKNTGAYASQTDLLNLIVFYSELIDFQQKRHLAYA